MRLHKRASLIARSIRELVEDAGGSSAQLGAIGVQLPPEIFDRLREDDAHADATELRVEGVRFLREDGRSSARRRPFGT